MRHFSTNEKVRLCLSTNNSNHRPSDQKFSRQQTMSLQYSSRCHIEYFKENIACKRITALFFARNHWDVRTDSGPIAEFVASLAWLAKREANWSCVKREFENLLRSYKTGLVLPINFYRTRIKAPVMVTRIKSSSNLLIFLVCFFVLFRADFKHLMLFFACCMSRF